VSSRARSGQARPEAEKVPAALARRRSRAAATLSLAGLAAVWVIPALLLRPLADPALLGFGTGFVVWIGTELIRNMANVRSPDQFPTPQVRLLTVRTWTGPCTIDMRDLKRVRARMRDLKRVRARMRDLKRVRARRSVSKVRIIDHIMVTDGAGVRIAFAGDNDRAVRLVQRALADQMRRPPGRGPARVSLAAARVLETRPVPWWVSPVWTVASALLPILIVLACAFTVISLAAG
jgi:hypothetical protein